MMEPSMLAHAVIPILRRLRQKDCEFQASLGYETLSQKNSKMQGRGGKRRRKGECIFPMEFGKLHSMTKI
jgi:hypothetical protein